MNFSVRHDGRCRPGAQRETVARRTRWLDGYLFEAQRAPAIEDGERCVERTRTTAGSSPSPSSDLPRSRYQSMVAPFGAQPWPAIDVTFLSRRGVHQHQCLAAEAVEVLLDHSADEHGGNARIGTHYLP